MPGFGHVDAVPLAFDGLFVYCVKVGVEAKENNVLGLGEDPNQIQNVGKRDAGPFGNEGPALFAGLMVDMVLGRKAL